MWSCRFTAQSRLSQRLVLVCEVGWGGGLRAPVGGPQLLGRWAAGLKRLTGATVAVFPKNI